MSVVCEVCGEEPGFNGFCPACRKVHLAALRAQGETIREFRAAIQPVCAEDVSEGLFSCGKCRTLMTIRPGSDSPEEGELVVCDSCAQELARIVLQGEP
jgi:hypothetical protein